MKVETTDNKIYIEVSLPVPRSKAWTILTRKHHVTNWWGDHVTLEASPDGTFLEKWFNGDRQVFTSGRITHCDPPSKLQMTWADDDWPGETVVTFLLAEHGNGTLLRLEHSGWDIHPYGKRRRLIDAHITGWSRYMERLDPYAADYHKNNFQA